ncbi:hypothetical protein EST38_g7677 [Candolleomyces aberdarensis]|uniref:G domain-containing protein n=1 Tax=Candolleomyces aberdarensis TaxID=2316362 RepID=A0A4Q2DEJ2_9AGAR|nr:hypothetical protein EST38_g7677 [Candolleomyces aberdarensis]
MSVSDTSYSPCTTKVQCLTVELKDIPQEWQRDYRLILVDTPGFDNQDKSNDDIFGEILQWLETKVPKGKQRGGVLYLRDAKPPFEVADGPVLKLLVICHLTIVTIDNVTQGVGL